MAYIYPKKYDLTDLPYSEKKVYELLEKLPNTYYIFHSVKWIKKTSGRKSTWKENDFIILNKNLGGLVLEVKGGDIACNGNIFRQMNKKTSEVSILSEEKRNDPLSQAIDGIYHYRRLIDTIKQRLSDRFPIEAAIWFSSCNVKSEINKFPLGYREISGAVLGEEDFRKGKAAIIDVFDFYKNRNKTNITDYEFHEIINLIASDFELITAPNIKKGELDYEFLKLKNEQTGLLDYISEQKQATIQGAAGTGKTIIAKEAARRLALEGRKVLFLCFNKFLYNDLMKRYPYQNVTYYNINKFVSEYGSGRDISITEDRVIELQKIDIFDLDFEDIIIDEAQDIENDEILYFRDLAELRDGHFLVFYDKNQIVSTRKVPKWIEESECKLILTKNCRNTQEIALTSYNVIDVELNQKVMKTRGERTFVTFTRAMALSKLAKLIKLFTGEKYQYEHNDIVILSLKTEDKSFLKGVDKISKVTITREKDKPGVLFTTSRKFKGLESRVVIVVDIDSSCFISEENKRNFYVACSRATHHLVIFIDAEDAEVTAMSRAINTASNYAEKGCIVMKLQGEKLEL